MKAGVASRTALGVARRRAAHQLLDQPVVFEDPLAGRIVGGIASAGKRVLPVRGSRSLRAFVAARSRYAEDELGAFFARGVRQYVVLGAGLDTFAYRNPYATALQVFEVDHPDTQVWKRKRLRVAKIAIPDSMRFVPVNFEKQDLRQVLETAAGFDVSLPAFFSMLEVTPYLTREALRKTLRCIGSMPVGSGVVFDYAVPAASLSVLDRIGLRMLSARVAMAGEALRLFLDPREVSGMLCDLGFSPLEDLGQEEMNARYFSRRIDGLQVGGALGRILNASVGPNAGLVIVPVAEVEQFNDVEHALAGSVKTRAGGQLQHAAGIRGDD